MVWPTCASKQAKKQKGGNKDWDQTLKNKRDKRRVSPHQVLKKRDESFCRD